MVALRVIGQFTGFVAAPLGVLFGAGIYILHQIFGFATPLLQALITGSVLAMGWLTATIFNELERRRARAEKTRDYHKAIYAEIGTSIQAFSMDGDFPQQLLDQMRSDEGFIPFIPKQKHDHVFSELVGDIEVLPRQTIDMIVGYYVIVHNLTALAEDMRSDGFAHLPQKRRIAIYEDYARLRRVARQSGEYVLEVIKIYSERGGDAAQAYIDGLSYDASTPNTTTLNNPDAAPSSHPQEKG